MPRVPWPPLVVLGIVLSAWGLGQVLPLETPHVPYARLAGWICVGAAALVELAALIRFRTEGTTILPHRDAKALVTDGLYRVSRNPVSYTHLTLPTIHSV